MSNLVIYRYLTESEERKFVAPIRAAGGWIAERDLNIVQLMRRTGVRVGTAVRLTVGDAQRALAEGRLYFRPEICKGGRGYPVECTAKVAETLRKLLAIRKRLGLGMDPDAALMVSRVGGRGGEWMTVRAVQMRFEYWRNKAGIGRPVSPHWMRHTLGQRIVRDSTATNPLGIAARQLGHRGMGSVMTYTQPNHEDVQQALREAGA